MRGVQKVCGQTMKEIQRPFNVWELLQINIRTYQEKSFQMSLLSGDVPP